MTFAELATEVIKKTYNFKVNPSHYLRTAENDFIERTNCTEEFFNADTNDLNSGTLSDLYNLETEGVTGFVREYRVEWNGWELAKISKAVVGRIYNSDNAIQTGTPTRYLIEDEQIRLIPKPTGHSYLSIWYCMKNTSTSSASPIMPAIDHRKIINYAIAEILEDEANRLLQAGDARASGTFSSAKFYKNKYLEDVKRAYTKYREQRFRQDRIIDGTLDQSYLGIEQRIPIVEEP